MAEKESWHLSKGVPITLILALVVQAAAIIGTYYQMQSDIRHNGGSIEKLEERVDRMRDESARRDVQLGRIEANQLAIKATLERMDRKLEGAGH